MKTTSFAIVVGALGQLAVANPAAALLGPRATCDADNCARAATGARGGLQASRLSDCSAFQTTSITLIPASNTAVVATGTVPAYASACSGSSRYSSACSCAGVTPSQTITISYPTDVPCGTGTENSDAVPGGTYTVTCGYDAGPGNAYTSKISSTESSYSSCFTRCDTNKKCLSFHYAVDTKECDLYLYDPAIDPQSPATHAIAQRSDFASIFTYFNGNSK